MKLNKAIKQKIKVAAIYRSSAIPKLAALVKDYAAFAEEIRLESMVKAKVTDAALDKALHEFKKAVPLSCIKATYLINEPPAIHCALGGLRATLQFDGANAIKLGKTGWYNDDELALLKCPALNLNTGTYKYVPDGEFMSQMVDANARFLDLEARKTAVHKELNTQITAIDQLLASVSTDTELLEIWPEAKTLIPKPESKKSVAKLPAIPVTDLNTMFNLPE